MKTKQEIVANWLPRYTGQPLKAFGKYKLSVVENTKTNPTRNIFKQTFYIKNLTQFDNLFKWIYDANERNYNKRYAETNKVMKNSLKY